MSDAAFDDLELYTIPKTDDPLLLARRAKIAWWALETSPETREEIVREARVEAHVEEARTNLRRVLTLRRLAASSQDEARIGACTDLDTLRRWHDQAVVAPNVAEALR